LSKNTYFATANLKGNGSLLISCAGGERRRIRGRECAMPKRKKKGGERINEASDEEAWGLGKQAKNQ